MEHSGSKTTLMDFMTPETQAKLTRFRQAVLEDTSESFNVVEQDAETNSVQIQPSESTPIELGKGEYTMNDLFKIDIDAIPFLVADFIPDNNLTILAGPSDVGKSTLYTQLITRIVTGKYEFLEKDLNTTCRNVLLISTEDDEVALSIRIKKQMEGIVPPEEQGNRLRIWTSGQDLVSRITAYLSINSLDLIVIDALGDVFSGGMNQVNDVRRFLDQLTDLCKIHKTAVLIVHHTRKSDSGRTPHKDQLLGSTGTEGKARSVLVISRVTGEQSQRGLHIVKGNYVEDAVKSTTTLLKFNTENLTFQNIRKVDYGMQSPDADSKPGVKKDNEKIEKARKLKDEGKSYSEIAKILNVNKSTVSRWFKRENIVFTVDENF